LDDSGEKKISPDIAQQEAKDRIENFLKDKEKKIKDLIKNGYERNQLKGQLNEIEDKRAYFKQQLDELHSNFSGNQTTLYYSSLNQLTASAELYAQDVDTRLNDMRSEIGDQLMENLQGAPKSNEMCSPALHRRVKNALDDLGLDKQSRAWGAQKREDGSRFGYALVQNNFSGRRGLYKKNKDKVYEDKHGNERPALDIMKDAGISKDDAKRGLEAAAKYSDIMDSVVDLDGATNGALKPGALLALNIHTAIFKNYVYERNKIVGIEYYDQGGLARLYFKGKRRGYEYSKDNNGSWQGHGYGSRNNGRNYVFKYGVNLK
jgi:hypothetical protein